MRHRDRHRRDGVAAPGLRETAEIWWDATDEPVVTWDPDGATFWLVDTSEPANRMLLWSSDPPANDPRELAEALASSLAACDFPPTGDGPPPSHVAAALRAHGVDA